MTETFVELGRTKRGGWVTQMVPENEYIVTYANRPATKLKPYQIVEMEHFARANPGWGLELTLAFLLFPALFLIVYFVISLLAF